ncbi:DUF3158 family protein [Billgrantia ethanolica]|uniref:DUF3158 family protein n=1 Tax=Billgrantia ethanolica TaxID=2733486 RepID=A0ABS9AA33_9GAMM|nr:DUF3158 family protein [Halomonas ethanolica]MCE8005318.1 DUF3158 family protein [Halomonas ethanolica]
MALDPAAPHRLQNPAPDGYGGFSPNPYAKGFLKPFYKGKGGVLRLRDELEQEADALAQEGTNLEQEYNSGLLFKLGISIRLHGDRGKRAPYLRWRDRRASKMGSAFWEGAMARKDITEAMRQKLYDLEVKRILFNARAGAINAELKQLRSVIANFERAEQVMNGQ